MKTTNQWGDMRAPDEFSEQVSTTHSVPFCTKITQMLLLCLSGHWKASAHQHLLFYPRLFLSFFWFLLMWVQFKSRKSPRHRGRQVNVQSRSQVRVEPAGVLDCRHWLNFFRTCLSLVSPSQVLYLPSYWNWDKRECSLLGFSPNLHLDK